MEMFVCSVVVFKKNKKTGLLYQSWGCCVDGMHFLWASYMVWLVCYLNKISTGKCCGASPSHPSVVFRGFSLKQFSWLTADGQCGVLSRETVPHASHIQCTCKKLFRMPLENETRSRRLSFYFFVQASNYVKSQLKDQDFYGTIVLR